MSQTYLGLTLLLVKSKFIITTPVITTTIPITLTTDKISLKKSAPINVVPAVPNAAQILYALLKGNVFKENNKKINAIPKLIINIMLGMTLVNPEDNFNIEVPKISKPIDNNK